MQLLRVSDAVSAQGCSRHAPKITISQMGAHYQVIPLVDEHSSVACAALVQVSNVISHRAGTLSLWEESPANPSPFHHPIQRRVKCAASRPQDLLSHALTGTPPPPKAFTRLRDSMRHPLGVVLPQNRRKTWPTSPSSLRPRLALISSTSAGSICNACGQVGWGF